MILRYLYTFFLAVLLVTFVGVGIAAFYKAPKYPEYPITTEAISLEFGKETTESAEMRQKRVEFEKESREFQKINEVYNKNVSTIAIVASLIILVVSITFLNKIMYLSDGLLLGGVFTLIYSVVRGFNAGDEMFRFIVVTIGLAVAIFLGYWKFVREQSSPKK
ncbi:MAG: hypothetical protein Q7T54_03310 [Candidatus Levybacteria bacterium]|nr:hypothetical protein [Candidatus Levybacteria bacterium]